VLLDRFAAQNMGLIIGLFYLSCIKYEFAIITTQEEQITIYESYQICSIFSNSDQNCFWKS